MAAAGAFRVEGMDHAILERTNRRFNKARLIQRIGMNRHLHIELICHG